MRPHSRVRLIILIFSLLLPLNVHAYSSLLIDFPNGKRELSCTLTKAQFKYLVTLIQNATDADKPWLATMPECLRENHKLIFQISLSDPSKFEYASNVLKKDENFIFRLIKVRPEILKYVYPRLLSDPIFMQNASYLSRDAIKYANPKLFDNPIFIKGMIDFDSKNYAYASLRLRSNWNYAEQAIADDGSLLKFAPDVMKNSKNMVMLAFNSDMSSLQYAGDKLRKDQALKNTTNQIIISSAIPVKEKLIDFLKKNYLKSREELGLTSYLTINQAKYFAKNQLIQRNYITKWHPLRNNSGSQLEGTGVDDTGDSFRLIPAESRNFPVTWKQDFKNYPSLISRIENFLLKHHVDSHTIEDLTATYFWKIKDKPLTFAFNLYLLRDTSDEELGHDYNNVISLTAIASERDKNWQLTVVDAKIDSEIKVNLGFPSGHARYDLWDLYLTSKKDHNPKIIFKVEDEFKNHFEVFYEQPNGKYRTLLSYDPEDNSNKIVKFD